MNYSTEQEDYLMTTPYTKKIQKKFKEVKNFLEKNGFAIEPEINPITQGESKKSFLLFLGILLPFLIGGIYYFKNL